MSVALINARCFPAGGSRASLSSAHSQKIQGGNRESREMGQLLVCVTKVKGLCETLEKEMWSCSVFAALQGSLPLVLATGDIKCAFY